MSKDLNLEDVARLSGVSRSTVSRVINNQEYVSPKTRDKVLEVIRKHGYQPNLAARALVSQRSKVIGILIPHDVSDLFTDPFFPTLLEGITLTSNQLGYGVTLWLATAQTDHPNFYASAFNNSLIDGLVIASATFTESFLGWLRQFPKPIAFVGAAPASMPDAISVDIDNAGGAAMAVNHLLEQGCIRIGIIEGRPRQVASMARTDGYIHALEQAGVPVDQNLIAPGGNYTEIGGYHGMQALLDQDVDGVFAANDMIALGAMRAIREAGLDVPGDIAVIGFDDIPFAVMSQPPLSTIRQPISLIGAETTRELIDYLEHDEPEAQQKVLPVELIVRESTVRR
jgi:LacI family transcriptional regulator